MSYKNNPLTYYNGFTSACRNVFLLSSVSLAMYGYSNTFKINSSVDIVKIGSNIILLFSIIYGVNTLYGMYKYIRYLKESNNNIPEFIQVNIWKNFMIITALYIVLLMLIFFVKSRRFINRKIF